MAQTTALQILEEVLQDPSLRDISDEHARRFTTSFSDALKGPLRSLGVGTSVAVAYTAARSAVALAPSAYHETWARVTLVLTVREATRRAARSGETVQEEMGRLSLDLAAAADRIGTKGGIDESKGTSEQLVSGAQERLTQSRELMRSFDDTAPFAVPYLAETQATLPSFVGKASSINALLRASLLRAASAAARPDPAAYLASPATRKRALFRWCIVETAGALAEGVPQALAEAAQAGSKDGKDAAMMAARIAVLILAALPGIDSWVWEADRDVEALAAAPPPAPPTTERRDDKMTQTPGKPQIIKTLQSDATDAAWRTAASQFVKLTKEPLVAMLSRHLGPEDPAIRNKIAAFLETDVGTALLASMLSVGLSSMPGVGGDAPQRLAKELRIKAMTDMGDLVADVLMGPLRQVMTVYLKDLPATPEPPPPAELPPAQTQSDLSGVSETATVSKGTRT